MSHKNMSFDPVILLMVNRADRQIAFQLLKRLLDFGELDVVPPEVTWIFSRKICSQQIPTLTPSLLP